MQTFKLLVALAFASTSFAASCVRQQNGGTYTYIVDATGVPNVSGTCGGLWDNLKRFSACGASATSCGASGSGNPLHWQFNTGTGCDGGMVESTWWEATQNNYGSIDCP